MTSTVGVVLMTFGTARTAADVPAYLSSVRGGHEAPADLIAEFTRRFELVGGSPLVEITERQAEAVEVTLNASASATTHFQVRAGMRHSTPTIRAAVESLIKAGADHLIGIVMSPQFSPRIMGGYITAFDQAVQALNFGGPTAVAQSWWRQPSFLSGLAAHLRAVLDQSEATTPVIFSAHSLPRSVADTEPEYLAALVATAEHVARQTNLPRDRWRFSYQSAGHTREEWLKPDLADIFPILQAEGHQRVVIAPVQFLSDHLEVLYDIDVAARDQAAAARLHLLRTPSLNDSPHLAAALAAVVHQQLLTLSSMIGAAPEPQ